MVFPILLVLVVEISEFYSVLREAFRGTQPVCRPSGVKVLDGGGEFPVFGCTLLLLKSGNVDCPVIVRAVANDEPGSITITTRMGPSSCALLIGFEPHCNHHAKGSLIVCPSHRL